MPNPENSHYFSKSPQSPQRIRKLFESIRNHTLTLQTSSGIFSPDEIDKGTRVLIDNLILPDNSSQNPINLLEIGAGYGPLCIWLNKEYHMRHHTTKGNPPIPNIYASEINDRALWLLNRNIVTNDCTNITILKGDFRDHIQELHEKKILFDAIYTNPPLKTGHEVMLELFEGAMQLLTSTGHIQYVHLKKLGAPGFLKKLQDLRPEWYFTIVKKKAGYQVILISQEEYQMDSEEKSYGGYF